MAALPEVSEGAPTIWESAFWMIWMNAILPTCRGFWQVCGEITEEEENEKNLYFGRLDLPGWCPRKKVVDLPHDFLVENPRNPKSVGWARNGFYDGANGDYTKYLTLDGEHVILDVDGAYMCARV